MFIEFIGRFINIIIYIIVMEMTTIAVRRDIKTKIDEFGNKGETYSDILLKLYEAAKKIQLRELLMSSEGCVSIDEAIREAEEKWTE